MPNCYVNDFTTSVKTYYNDIKKCNPISREEEKVLMSKAKKNDLNAKNKILTSNLKFVFDVAKKYKGYGVPMEDLISEGNLGLAYAFDKFDESKNVKFISYAVWWIKWYIQDYIQRRGNVSEKEVSEEELLKPSDSNNLNDDELMLKDVIMSDENDTIENEHHKEEKEIINKLLSKLDLRERTIIECYFGLKTGKSMTLEECSKILNLSKERIRQVKAKSLLKLRSEMLLLM